MMNSTERIAESAGETYEYAKLYLEQQKDFLRLEVAEKVAVVTSKLGTAMVLGMLAFLVITLFSLSLGFYLGGLWNSLSLGFLASGGIVALLSILLYITRTKWLTHPILDHTLKLIFERDSE